MKKLISALLALTLAFTLTACQSQTQNQNPTEEATSNDYYPVTVTTYDYAGNPVETTYDKAPEKVLAVYQGSIETMIALGLEDHVVASYGLDNEVKDEWKDGFLKMNYQEEPFSPDKETVTLLQPDMILSWNSIFGEKNLGDSASWIANGTNTYVNSNTVPDAGRTLANEMSDILNIGKIFNVQEKANQLVQQMEDEIQKVKEKTEGKDPVSVMVIEPISDTITNYGKNSLAGDMVTILNGTLAAPDSDKVGKEDLLAANPDVIFVVYMAYSGDDPETVMNTQLSIIKDDPALKSLKAVQENKIYPIMLGDMYASGPRTLDGIKTLSSGMYPEQN